MTGKLHFIALKHRDFRLFWGGSFISQMGDQMQTVAVAWQLYAITHSAASLGLIGLSTFFPIIIFSLIGGVFADRVNRKKLLILCQGVLGILALILFLTTHFNIIQPWMIYIILGLAAIANSFNTPARQSVIVNLVPREIFVNAVSLNTLQRQSAIIIGPAIAGFIIAGWGVQSVYLFNVISFIGLIVAFLFMRIPEMKDRRQVELHWSSIKEGIQFVASKPILYSTMGLDFLASFFGTANILMPIFASDVLKVGAQGLGFLYSAPAIGGVIAGLYFAGQHKIKNQGKIIIISVLIYGAAIVGFGFSKNFYLSILFLVIMGMGDMISTIIRNTLRQLLTPDYIRGRMVSINMIFVQGGPQAGDMEAGFLAHGIGAPMATVIGGVGTILVALLIAKFVPDLRKYKGDDQEYNKK
jgi:MFS family permease